MFKNMSENLKKIEQIYLMPGNHLVCLEGKKGTGKTTVLQEFFNTQENVIQVDSLDNNNYVPNPLHHNYHPIPKILPLHYLSNNLTSHSLQIQDSVN